MKTNCTSRFQGIYWRADNKKWRAEIKKGHKRTNLGPFADEIEAATVYNGAASRLYGDFALLNNIGGAK